MISDDRRLLNERFIKVFKVLEERGDVIKNDRNGKGLGDFAEKIVGNRAYGHIIRAFLNEDDKRCISYEQARRVCNEYGVNYTYLLEGEGSPFGLDIPETDPENADVIYKGNILFTTTEAFAGVSVDAGSFKSEEHDFFALPGLSGSGLVAFPISGNSMEPVILDGDIAVCREIAGVHEIKDNRIYAVKNNGSVWIKYVQRIRNDKGRVTHLKLISANHLEYDPFVEDVNEYPRLYEVVRRVSSL
jgi:phage repressor protein C with HTH and peptisase S24 domain